MLYRAILPGLLLPLLALAQPAAAQVPPIIELGDTNQPNPLSIDLSLPVPTVTIQKLGFSALANGCRLDNARSSSPQPVLRLKSSIEGQLALYPHGKSSLANIILAHNGKYFCNRLGSDEVTLHPGDDFEVFQAREPGTAAETVRLNLALSNVPLRVGGNTAVYPVDGPNQQPDWVEIKLDPATLSRRPASCDGYYYGEQPAAILKRSSGGPLTLVSLQTVGYSKDLSVAVMSDGGQVATPLEKLSAESWLKRPWQCGGWRQLAIDQREELEDGTYALFVGVRKGAPPPRSVRLLLRSKRTEVADPFSIVERPLPTTPPGERTALTTFPLLRNYHDYVKQVGGDLALSRMVEAAPKELFLFARQDLEEGNPAQQKPRRIAAGEPLLLIQSTANESATLQTLDGSQVQLPIKELRAATDTLVFPTTVWPMDKDSLAAAKEAAGPEAKPLLAEFDKKMEKFGACSERVWRSIAGDLPAGYDLLVIRGTHVSSTRSKAESAVWSKCGGAANEQLKIDTLAKLNALRTEARRQMMVRLSAIIKQRFAEPSGK